MLLSKVRVLALKFSKIYVKNNTRMCNLHIKHIAIKVFQIYNASAGSGKTYQLTKAYLKLVLAANSKQKYRELLAITFTNKAVAEMKQRILENLYAFSKPDSENDRPILFDELRNELGLSTTALQTKSKRVLKELLHNYAFFEISTIDKFTHKIIRTFARDLKISQGFDVVLDTDILLEEAVGRLLNRAGEEDELTKVLLDFSLEKIDDDKSWNIAYDLFEIGKLLFQENHSKHLKKFKNKEIGEFLLLQSLLNGKIKKIEKLIVSKAESVLAYIVEKGFEFSDFPRETLPNHFKKLASLQLNSKSLYGNKLEENLEEGKILKTTINKPEADIAEILLQEYIAIKELFYLRHFLKNSYKNIVPLTLLNEIDKEVGFIQKEKDLLPISEFNAIISKEIKNQPVPFIYERLGEKYRHYFIDEFQDTSQMQWENLIPLIGNAVESENEKGEKGSLLLVGDAKQAIYRWRGGRAEQFLNLLNLHTNPFVLEPQIENLETNWRSKKKIVDFNNAFFNFAAKKLNHPTYKNLFEEGNRQKANNEEGGYIELIFARKDAEEINDQYCVETLKVLKTALNEGYRLQDVCILVRSNQKGALIADYLTEQEIPIISPDSLLLANNSEVSFLVSVLEYIHNTDNKEASYSILDYLSGERENRHNFISEHLILLETLLDKQHDFKVALLKRLPIYDILEKAIFCFDLTGHSNAHLSHFMDEVFDFSQKEDASIFSFLRFWSQKKEKLSVKAPESLNAVKIMTVHKSKGLEFPVVIFPYADSKIVDHRSKKLWLQVEKKSFEDFDELLIDSSKELENYGEVAQALYNDELNKLELDAYNVLYVALTRAKNALFIISNEQSNKDSYSELFIDYLKEIKQWSSSQLVYNFGKLSSNKLAIQDSQLQESIPYIASQKNSFSFKIVSKAEMLWDLERQEAIEEGNMIHKALSEVRYQEDLEDAVISLKNYGHIKITEMPLITEKLKQIVFHPKLIVYYQNGLVIYNEKELLTPDGVLLRPDRLVINEKNVTIMDYKTGNKSESHKIQLQEYASVLKKMNYVIENMILIYINKTVNPIFI